MTQPSGQINSSQQQPLLGQGVAPSTDSSFSCIRLIRKIIVAPFWAIYSAFSGLLYWCFDWGKREVKVEHNLTPQGEYQKLVQLHETLDPKLFLVAQENMNRNRFSNILPNEPTRFKLNHDPSFYFNANWVMGGKALASQGPLPGEINEFCKMVWNGNIDTIVMLANPVEQGRPKCSEYWKTGTISEAIVYKEDGVQICERKFCIKRGEEKRIITQYHLQNWPDFGVVSPSILAKLVQLVSKKEGGGPLLAHCSAGVGRTGTFLAAYQAYQEKNGNLFRIAADLRDPEKGRVGMIQTPEQYALAKDAIALLIH